MRNHGVPGATMVNKKVDESKRFCGFKFDGKSWLTVGEESRVRRASVFGLGWLLRQEG